MRFTKGRLILLMAGAVGVLAVARDRATADPYPGTNDARFPDAAPHVACWVPNPNTGTIPFPIWDHLFAYMDTTLRSQTGVTVAWTTDCSDLADMRLDDRLTDPTLFGLRSCVNASGNVCLGSNVLINPSTIASSSAAAGISNTAMERKVWCHETGHSMGLGHENGCLVSGVSTANAYSAHHVTHLNAQF